MSKIEFPDGACLKGTISGTQLSLVNDIKNENQHENDENKDQPITVDLSSFKRIKIIDNTRTPDEIEFTDTVERRKILETCTMHIEKGEKHFIWIVVDYVPQINQELGKGLSAILMGIGTDNPRNGRGHYVGNLSDTSTQLNIKITEDKGKTSVTIQTVGDIIPTTTPTPPSTQTAPL